MAREVGARTSMGLALEGAYGVAPVSGFVQLPYAKSGIGAEQPLLASELLGQGRDPVAPVKDAIEVSGDMTVPIDTVAIGFWLRGLMGSPVTTGAGPYTHTFQSNGWNLPSMALELQYPAIPQFNMFTGVMVDSLSWEMQRSGLLTAQVGLMAQNEVKANTTQAGTITPLSAGIRFGNFSGAIKRNGSALANVVGASINYKNNLDPVGTIRGDGLFDGFDPGMTGLTGSATVRIASTLLYDQAILGNAAELIFEYAPSVSTVFRFTAHEVYFSRPRMPIEGPGGIQITFDWTASVATSPARMATAVLINSRSAYA